MDVAGADGSLISLILGGARSGKSALGERRAAATGADVTYLATGVSAPDDPEFAERIARHRERRPAEWKTIEVGRAGDLVSELRSCSGTALVDSLGTWLAGFQDFTVRPAALTECVLERAGRGLATVVISEEVSFGVHPASDAGRRFRDALGELNQAVAIVADDVILVVAGRALSLPKEQA